MNMPAICAQRTIKSVFKKSHSLNSHQTNDEKRTVNIYLLRGRPKIVLLVTPSADLSLRSPLPNSRADSSPSLLVHRQYMAVLLKSSNKNTVYETGELYYFCSLGILKQMDEMQR